MLLWFLKDQRVYLHNVLFLACFNWEFFQGVEIHDTMSLTNVQNSVRNISPRGPYLNTGQWRVHIIIMKSMTEFSTSHRTRVVCLFPRTLDDCWTEPRREEPLCATVRRTLWPGVEPVITGCESSPKTCLKLGFKHSLSIILCILVQLDLIEAC